MTPNQRLMVTGRSLGVKSITSGRWHAILQSMAQRHAGYQARVHQIGHQNWDARFQELVGKMPGYRFAEVCAMSWRNQGEQDAADEIFKSWRASPGHWSTVNGTCVFWGYAMSRGTDGIWYGTGIVAQ